MDGEAGVDSMEAMMASMAALAVLVDRSEGRPESTGPDPLRDQADACLDGLEETARLEAMLAARKVRFAAGFAATSQALAAPAKDPGQHTAQEMGVVAEVACALTVSERSASALLAQSHELTTALPLTLAALEAGDLSWQHARIMVDETASLDPAGAASLEAHYLAAGPGHSPSVCAPGPHRRTRHPRWLRADPGIHGPQPRRRRGILFPPGPR